MAVNPFRNLPPVNDLLDHPAVSACEPVHGRDAVMAAVRAELDRAREAIKAGLSLETPADLLAECVVARLTADAAPRLRPVVNATGIVLHTNLGRAPMAEAAARRLRSRAAAT